MEKIAGTLREIERSKQITILYACETGSRAWGFPSPDSDYDIRFIYRHSLEWYVELGHRKDTIEYPVNEDLDITGWDLRKSLLMLKKSNAALIERFQSPVEYFSEPGFKTEFKNLIADYYSPTAVFYHHHSLAKKFRDEIEGKDKVKLKSYFYLLRSLLSCHWIIKDKMVVPMHIEGLMEKIEDERKHEIRQLIKLKAGVGEKYLHPAEKNMNAWIDELWEYIESSKNNLGVANKNYGALNDFFLRIINVHADNRIDKK